MNLETALLVAAVMAVGTASAADRPAEGPRIESVAANETSLVVQVKGAGGARLRLVEVRPYQAYAPDAGLPVPWEGTTRGTITLPRLEGKRDRLYSKLQLVEAATGRALGAAQYATDLSGIRARDFDFPWPKSIKGITCPMNVEDVVALGVKYLNTNIMVPALFDWNAAQPDTTWEVDGERFPINTRYLQGLDDQIRRFTEAGINVTVVLLNGVPTKPDPRNPLIHPATDLAGAPNHLGGFNLTDERGLRAYRTAVEFLAERYSRPDRKYGWITGYIVGNELQAHWHWYNLGRMPAAKVVEEYLRALRVTDLALRRTHAKLRTYVSMDHHWTLRSGDATQWIAGDGFLRRVNAGTKAEGDFPWHVAFHPYPEDLFNPRSWEDRTATLGFDTKRITFKNIEVLPAFLQQKEYLCQGRPRRIILSEQGLDSSRAGEEVQAAAYAYAYYRCSRTPGIDAFMLHRHVDHGGEGGLLLGLWTFAPGTTIEPGRKKRAWEVFRAADTDEWEQTFAFAKPIIGIREWSELDPAREIGPVSPPPPPLACTPEGRLDLVAHLRDAECKSCLDWRRIEVEQEGRKRPAIFHHPPAQGDGDAAFRVKLPARGKVLLRFATAFSGPTGNGARFSVLLDGKEAWRAEQRETAPVEREVDLTPWAGKTVSLTLRVNALGDLAHDWCNWVEPRITVEWPASAVGRAESRGALVAEVGQRGLCQLRCAGLVPRHQPGVAHCGRCPAHPGRGRSATRGRPRARGTPAPPHLSNPAG